MIVQQRDVKGGIAAVTNGYYGSALEEDYDVRYVESYRDGSKLQKFMKAVGGYNSFARVVFAFRPDLVHIHASFGPSFYRMQPFLYMAKICGIPVVDHCHGADFDTFYVNASERKKRRIRKVYRDFDKVIVLSDEWKEKFLKVVGAERIVVIHNYCKPKAPEEVEKLVEKRFSEKRVLFLGEIGKRKGGFDFADIIKKTCEKMEGVKFDICGDGSREDVDSIKADIKRNNPSAKVIFPGWVRDKVKDRHLSQAAVFMLPSYNEGMPMSILDAMAYGLPVASTNIGGIPQLVKDGESGFLAQPGDADKISDGIAALLTDIDKYRAFSLNSLLFASENYGFDVHLKKLEEVYESVLKAK